MRSKSAAADLAFAGHAGSHWPAIFIDHANAKGWHGETQVAAAGQQRQLHTHHGEAAQFHHAVAVQEHRRNPPAARQPEQRAKLPQLLPDFGGQMVAGREPRAHAPEPRGFRIAAGQPHKHLGHADEGSDSKALDKVQRARDVETIEEAAANARHQAVERNAYRHNVRPGQRDERQVPGPKK